jgi:hypothetical protein
MQAALFTYRCFEKPADEFPFNAGAFILCGQSELMRNVASKKFNELVAASGKSPARIHKVGPLSIHPLIKTRTAWQEIDWAELSRRVEQEKPVRPENEGSCIFSESEMSPQEFELPPDVAAAMQKELQLALLSQAPQCADGRRFLFIGSAFKHDCFERTGIVYLIEAPSLTHASAVCAELVKGMWKTSVHVEWCCPIYRVCGLDK